MKYLSLRFSPRSSTLAMIRADHVAKKVYERLPFTSSNGVTFTSDPVAERTRLISRAGSTQVVLRQFLGSDAGTLAPVADAGALRPRLRDAVRELVEAL